MINLFFSESAGGSGACHRKELGIEISSIYTLDLCLHAGDISVPFSVSKRREVYNAHVELDEVVSDDIRRLKKGLKQDNSLCMWYSANDVDEYLAMLATLYQFNGKGVVFYECDCTDICESVSYLQDEEHFGEVNMVQLSNEEISKRLSQWQQISVENSALRMIDNRSVISLPADYIDERIFDYIGDKSVKVTNICEHILAQDDMQRKLAFLMLRLRQLIDAGALELVSYDTAYRDDYIPPAKNIMRYTLKRP